MTRNEAGSDVQLATFAGGCFWCMVKPFDELPGIVSVVSGYTGGHTSNPTYEDVCTETTGHAEAVQIAFRPEMFPYRRLLELFWQQIDPTDKEGQFQDRGHSFRTAIFVHNGQQREEAEASKRELQASGRFRGPIVTEIVDAGPFYPAEDYHQHYYRTHPMHYRQYAMASGRDKFIERSWNGERDRARLRRELTDIQYEVTRNNAEEPAFDNAYWDNGSEGLYVDIITGDPLFSSKDKFDAGNGWPAFSKPLHEGLIRKEGELSGGRARTALRSRLGNSRLGYLLYDGPSPVGLHYLVYSAALRFIPREELEREGYGQYAESFR